VPFRSYRSLLFQFRTLRFEPPFGVLVTTHDVHLGLIGKRVGDFLLVLIELFSLGVTADALRAKIDGDSRRFRSNAVNLIQNFRYKGSPATNIFAWLIRPINALQLCR